MPVNHAKGLMTIVIQSRVGGKRRDGGYVGVLRVRMNISSCSCYVYTGPLSNADDSFIVADGRLRNIYQVDPSTGATSQLLPFGAAARPRAVAYDSHAKLLYWTDVILHTINRYSLLTNSSTVIYRDPTNTGKITLCLPVAYYMMQQILEHLRKQISTRQITV